MSENATTCLACGQPGLEPFYEVENVPVHSVVLMPTREDALDIKRGDVRLAFCPHCGFIQNTAFNPGSVDYTQRTEETQAFSGTFNAFAQNLARSLVERYELYDKQILEIGGGKGEFLLLLCELGHNSGVGIDPSYVPDRLKGPALERIEFIREFYDERYEGGADFIACRHTLEHVPDVGRFVSLVRKTAERSSAPVVFFEVPDVARVLDELAFWDIYHEHCSYFTLGSLARLFRSSGFDLLDLATAFDDQYLLIDARLGHNDAPLLRGEDDLTSTAETVEFFAKHHREKLDDWRGRLASLRDAGSRVAIWGAGSKGVAFLTTLGVGEEIAAAVDINPHKQGLFMPGSGHPVIGPQDLIASPPDAVIVMNPVYLEEIEGSLAQMGMSPTLLVP